MAPLALILIAAALLKTSLVARLAGTMVQTLAEAALGEEVTVGAVTLSYFPPEIGLEGLVISSRTDGERIVAVRSIHALFGVKDWRAGLVRLTVDTPDVLVHLDEDGLREFRDAAPSANGAPKLTSFPWMELVIHDGHLLLEGADTRVELSGLEVVPEPHGLADVAFSRLEAAVGSIHETAGPTRFKHVELSPGRVDAPSIDVRFDHLAVDGSLRVESGGTVDAALAIRAALPGFTTNPEDPRAFVDGVVELDIEVTGATAHPAVAARLATRNVVWWRVDSHDNPAALAIGDVVGTLSFSGHTLRAEHLRVPWGGGVVDVVAEVDTTSLGVTLAVVGESLHLGRALRSAGAFASPWVDFQTDLEVHAVGTLSPLKLVGPFEFVGTDLIVRDGVYDGTEDVMLEIPHGRLIGNLEIDSSHLVLDATDTRFGPGRGTVWGDIGFGPLGPLDVRIDLDNLDLTWLQPLGGAGLGGSADIVARLEGPFGRLRAEATLDVQDAVVLDLPIADRLTAQLDTDLTRLDFSQLRGELGATQYLGNVSLVFQPEGLWIDTQLVVPEGRLADLTGIFVDLGDVDASVTANAVLHGPPQRLSGEVHVEFADVEAFGERFDEGVATAWMDDGVLTLDDLSFRRPDEAILARGTVGHGFAMNTEILSDGLRIERLNPLRDLPFPVTGELIADLHVGGTLFDWQPQGRVVLQRTQIRGRNVADSVVRFTTDRDGQLSFRAAFLGEASDVNGNLRLNGDQPYDLQASFKAFPISVLYPDGAEGSPVEATVTGEVDLAGHLGDDPTPVDVEGRFGEVKLAWNGHTLRNDEEWVVAVHGRSVQVPGLSLTDGARTRLTLAGWTTADGRAAFRGGGTIDLDFMRMFAPGVSLAEGTGTLDLDAGTGVGARGLKIAFAAEDATLRAEVFPSTFTGLGFRVESDGSRYTLSGVKAEVGGGTFTAEGTIASGDGWVPTRFDLRGGLRDARLQYLDYLPPIVGDADIRFDGPAGDLLMSGTVNILDMQFRDRIDWERKIVALQSSRLTDSAAAEKENYFSLDLAVKANETIRLRNNIADATASVDLRIVGDTARPGMVGRIEVGAGGRVYLQDREFEIARGELRYVDPYRFDPDLDVQLETDLNGRDQTYHVYYGLTGPFSNWTTSTSSDPFLSQADINTLLLFGMTRDEFEQYGATAAVALAAQATDLVAAQVAASPAQIVDRWNLVSGINSRGTPTLDSNWRVVAEKDFLGFTAAGELDLADYDMYLALERKVTRSFFASVYVTSQEEGRSLDLGAAAGTELKYRWELD